MFALQPSVDELNAVIGNYSLLLKGGQGQQRRLFLSPQVGLLHRKGLEKNTHTLFHERPGDALDQDMLGTANWPLTLL